MPTSREPPTRGPRGRMPPNQPRAPVHACTHTSRTVRPSDPVENTHVVNRPPVPTGGSCAVNHSPHAASHRVREVRPPLIKKKKKHQQHLTQSSKPALSQWRAISAHIC